LDEDLLVELREFEPLISPCYIAAGRSIEVIYARQATLASIPFPEVPSS
jgi:hypothetical protein